MRQIGHLDSELQARAFGGYLYAQGIANQVEPQEDERWAVWVESEDQIDQAEEELARFRQNPADPRYETASGAADARRAREEKAAAETRTRYVDARVRMGISAGHRPGVLTLALIAVCVGVAAWSSLGTNNEVLNWLLINSAQLTDTTVEWQPGLPDILHGQVWRLFTPMFIHFGILHLVFNLFWLNDLGSVVERRQGTLVLALLVLVVSAVSDLAQYAVSGPLFGGMSGVVYSLFGYVWIRGKCDLESGLYVSRQTVIIMLVWFVLCLTGLLGPVANMAHGTGLVIGMVWGYLSWRRVKLLRAGGVGQ